MNPITDPKNIPQHPLCPPATRDELLTYLRESGSALSPAEALAGAVKLWIATDRAGAGAAAGTERGYQWKQLFLPESTRVRMRYADDWFCAEVVGDDLIYQARPVSPNQMVRQIAGDGRNAWLELWIRLPGEKHWKTAARLRASLADQPPAAPLSPSEAMVAAAKAMSDALNTALVLVEHANHQSQNTLERRLPRYRRGHDLLDDIH
jgi:hypothetical protein